MNSAPLITRLLTTLLIVPVLFFSVTSYGDDTLSAVGIGVKNLKTSEAFYQDILGLNTLRTYELGYINEIVLGYKSPKSAALVLMNWPDQKRRYDGTDVKLVFYVKDPGAVIERIRGYGFEVLREASPIEALNGRVVGLARDPDNYVVEVIESE